MNRPLFPHDLDLGAPVDAGTLEVLMQGQRDGEMVRGILQTLRNHAANIERTGRQSPSAAVKDPLEWRAYHAGGADAAEEMLMMLWALANPNSRNDKPIEEADEN